MWYSGGTIYFAAYCKWSLLTIMFNFNSTPAGCWCCCQVYDVIIIGRVLPNSYSSSFNDRSPFVFASKYLDPTLWFFLSGFIQSHIPFIPLKSQQLKDFHPAPCCAALISLARRTPGHTLASHSHPASASARLWCHLCWPVRRKMGCSFLFSFFFLWLSAGTDGRLDREDRKGDMEVEGGASGRKEGGD